MDERTVLGEQGRLDDLVVPIDGKRLVRLVDERVDEGQEVARVKRRGRRGETAGDIEIAEDGNAVIGR